MEPSDEYWRNQLLALKDELLRLETESKDSRGTVELDQSRVGRLSRIDAMQSQAMNKAVSARRKQALVRISSALERVDEGEFGFCMKCGDDILAKRLELDPTAIYCANCNAS